jgi:hypothetical protein
MFQQYTAIIRELLRSFFFFFLRRYNFEEVKFSRYRPNWPRGWIEV